MCIKNLTKIHSDNFLWTHKNVFDFMWEAIWGLKLKISEKAKSCRTTFFPIKTGIDKWIWAYANYVIYFYVYLF